MDKRWTCAVCEATSAGTAVKRAGPKALICDWCADQLAQRGHAFCRHCRTPQPLPFRRWCPTCANADAAARYQRNRAARLATNRARYQERRTAYREREAAYRTENRDAINARRRSAYALDPEPRRSSARLWGRAHRDVRRRWRARNPGYNAAQSRLFRMRRKVRTYRSLFR